MRQVSQTSLEFRFHSVGNLIHGEASNDRPASWTCELDFNSCQFANSSKDYAVVRLCLSPRLILNCHEFLLQPLIHFLCTAQGFLHVVADILFSDYLSELGLVN
jgi:hypothetical protein